MVFIFVRQVGSHASFHCPPSTNSNFYSRNQTCGCCWNQLYKQLEGVLLALQLHWHENQEGWKASGSQFHAILAISVSIDFQRNELKEHRTGCWWCDFWRSAPWSLPSTPFRWTQSYIESTNRDAVCPDSSPSSPLCSNSRRREHAIVVYTQLGDLNRSHIGR